MENRIYDILEGYSIFFKSGEYSLLELRKQFSTSEFYDSGKDVRSYYLPEYYNDIKLKSGDSQFRDETFDEYISVHVESIDKGFKENLLGYLTSINSDKRQNAILYSVLAYLQNFINILRETEDPTCDDLMKSIEDSRDFILNVFSRQLGLDSDEKKSQKRESLSSYFRGIRKLQFNLQKNEIALLFMMLMDSKLLDYPLSDNELAKFLDNNAKYFNSNFNRFQEMKDTKVEISRLRDQGSENDMLRNNIIKTLSKPIKLRS